MENFKECFECKPKPGSPYLCAQCLWVRENYKPKPENRLEKIGAISDLKFRDTINSLIDARNKMVEAVKYLARRLNTGTDKGTLEENINQILNS